MFSSLRRSAQHGQAIHPAMSTDLMDTMDGIPPSYLRQRATSSGSFWNNSRDSFFSRCFSVISGNSSAETSFEGPLSPTHSFTSFQGPQSMCLGPSNRSSPTLATLQADLRGAWAFEHDSRMEGMEYHGTVPHSAFSDASSEDMNGSYGNDDSALDIDATYRPGTELGELDPPPPYTPFEAVEEHSQMPLEGWLDSNASETAGMSDALERDTLEPRNFSSAPLGGMTDEERRILTGPRGKDPKIGKRFNFDRVSTRVGKGLNSVKSRVRKLPQTTQRLQDGLRVMRARNKAEQR